MDKIEEYLKEKGLDKNTYLMQKNRDGSVTEMYLKDVIEEYVKLNYTHSCCKCFGV